MVFALFCLPKREGKVERETFIGIIAIRLARASPFLLFVYLGYKEIFYTRRMVEKSKSSHNNVIWMLPLSIVSPALIRLSLYLQLKADKIKLFPKVKNLQKRETIMTKLLIL